MPPRIGIAAIAALLCYAAALAHATPLSTGRDLAGSNSPEPPVAAGIDSLFLPDSVAVADSLVGPDSLGWAALGGDSTAPAAPLEGPEFRRWEPGWALAGFPIAVVETLLVRQQLFTSSALLLSEALGRETRLGLHRAGCHGTWDLPFVYGPGIERLSLWHSGEQTVGAAIPEALCHTVSAPLIGHVLLLAPDPFLDPLASGRDGMIWGEEPTGLPDGVPSSVRLTEGAGGVGTQDLLLARSAGPWQLRASYSYSRGDGRPTWVQPRYTETRFQNLRAVLDRSIPAGPVRMVLADREGKWWLAEGGKLVWESDHLSAAWQFGQTDGWSGELQLARRNDLLRWWGPGGDSRRRSTSTAAILRGVRRSGALAWMLAGGAERVGQKSHRADLYARNWSASGTGVAMGGSWKSGATEALAIVGYSDPWWGEGSLRGHAALGHALSGCLSLAVEGWNGSDVPFTPRLEGDEEALLEQGILLPGLTPAEEGSTRRVWHLEARARIGRARTGLGASLFVRRYENGIGLDPNAAELLAPDVRDSVGSADLISDATLRGGSLSARLQLPLGAAISGDLTGFFAPEADSLPVLVSALRARGVFSLGGSLFRGDLRWEGRLIYQMRGDWTTPYGESPGYGRFDGEIHGTIGDAHIYLALRNLENATHPSATYREGEWMPQMFRSYQAGVEWHFLD